MTKKLLVLCAVAALMVVGMAVPAFATSHATPSSIYGDLVAEATPWFTGLIAVIAGVFGLGLALKFGRKVARMIAGALGKA
jgi:hypothetical protein